MIWTNLIGKVTKPLPYLESLKLDHCYGNGLSSFLTAAAPSLIRLEINQNDIYNDQMRVDSVMSNLKVVIMKGKQVDISKCPDLCTSTGKLKNLLRKPRKKKEK